jgi:hypothetical protein
MDAYARATAQMARMGRHYPLPTRREGGGTESKSAAVPAWEWLGPANQAGRTRTLVFDPRNPNRIFVGGVLGRRLDLRERRPELVAALGQRREHQHRLAGDRPAAPDTIYAGTGELYRNSAQPYSAMWGQGILKSTDGGLTFEQLPATANDDFRYVSDIVLSPHDHLRLLRRHNTGIWRSNDGGGTFTQLLATGRPGQQPAVRGCTTCSIRPDQPTDFVLASCASRSTDDRYWIPGTDPAARRARVLAPAAIFVNTDACGGTGSVPVEADRARHGPHQHGLREEPARHAVRGLGQHRPGLRPRRETVPATTTTACTPYGAPPTAG